jgi:translocation and assembly module TamB
MTNLKKITAGVILSLCSFVVILFCLIFTAPGNQFIIFSANKLVNGLDITLDEGRLFYNDPIDIVYSSPTLNFSAQHLKLDLYWWRCDGLCIDNVSAKTITVDLKQAEPTIPPLPQESTNTDSGELNLPFAITVKRIAVVNFDFSSPSTDVHIQQFQLSAKANTSQLVLKAISVNTVELLLKETAQQTPQSLTTLTPLPKLDFTSPFAVNIEQAALKLLKIKQGEQQHEIKNINTALAIKNTELKINTFSADYLQWTVSSELSTELNGLNPINAKIKVDSQEHQFTLAVNGDLSDLQLSVNSQGKFPLEAILNVDLKTTNFPFSLNANAKQWKLDTQSHVLSLTNMALVAAGDADDYKINLSGASQLGAFPAVTLDAFIKGSLTYVSMEQLSLLSNDSSAQIKASARWNEGIDSEFSVQLNSLKAQYLTDIITSDISGQVQGTFNTDQENWHLKIHDTQLTGLIDGVDFVFDTDFELTNDLHANIKKFELTSADSKLAIAGSIDRQWSIDTQLKVNKTAQDQLPFTGIGNGSLKIRGERLKPEVNLELALKELSYDDVSVAGLNISSDFNYEADYQTNATINIANIQLHDYTINRVRVGVNGDKQSHYFHFDLDANEGKAEFDVTGVLADQIWQGQIKEVRLTDHTMRLTTNPHIDVSFNTHNGNFSVAKHCWQSEQSKLCIDKLLQKNGIGTLVARLNNLDVYELKHILPNNIKTEGELTGEIKANWHETILDSFSATLRSKSLAATIIEDEKSYRLPIEIFQINANSDAIKASMQASMSSSVLGDVTADIALEDLLQKQTLSGSINIDKILLTDLQPFTGVLEQLKGDVSGEVLLSGTLMDPLLNGEVHIADINLQGEQLPISVIDSHVAINFDKTTASVNGTFNDLDGGSLNLAGGVDWGRARPAVNLALNGDQFYVRVQQGVIFKISPDLKISLADNALKLVGQVKVPYGRVTIEELPEGAVQVSDDTIIVDRQREQAESVPFDYAIALQIIVNDDVKIDSFGLKSKIEGDLNLKMDKHTPMIATGELNLKQGTYYAFGQDLIIRTGQIGFSGPIDKPYLNIKAIRNPQNTANGVTAGVALTGNVEQPSLKVFSEPSMDQAHSLAYLLNGQPLDEGNSSTDAMLTQLLLAQGVSRSEGLVSKVGETFGLSDVSLSSKGSGDDTKVEISGYLAPGIQVKYSVGIFESLSEVAVRYQLLSQLFIEITSGLNQEVDILYKFDWDE